MSLFTCHECGAQGDPPACDHFCQPWTPEQIAAAHQRLREIRARTPGALCGLPVRAWTRLCEPGEVWIECKDGSAVRVWPPRGDDE